MIEIIKKGFVKYTGSELSDMAQYSKLLKDEIRNHYLLDTVTPLDFGYKKIVGVEFIGAGFILEMV